MTPAFRVEINGSDVTDRWAPALVSMRITDEAGLKSDTLEVEFSDRDRIAAPPIGATVRVWLGYEPQPMYRGAYKVDEWSRRGPARTLRISAKAAEMTSQIRATKSRSWSQKTVGEIARAIGAEHGLTVVIDGGIDRLTIQHIDQQNESDLAFLTRLSARVGATFKLGDGQIVMSLRGSANLPRGGQKPTLRLTPDMVSDWELSTAERGDYKSVSCVYMDHARGRRITVTEGSGTPRHRDRRVYATEAEARAAARSQLGDVTRGKLNFRTNGPGLTEVFAEGKVRAEGFDPDADREYLVKSAEHSLDSSGYQTSLAMESGQSAGG